MKSCGCLKVRLRRGTWDTRPGCFGAEPSIYCSSSFWTLGDIVLLSSTLLLIFLPPPPSSVSFSSSVSSLLSIRPLFCVAGELGHEKHSWVGPQDFFQALFSCPRAVAGPGRPLAVTVTSHSAAVFSWRLGCLGLGFFILNVGMRVSPPSQVAARDYKSIMWLLSIWLNVKGNINA